MRSRSSSPDDPWGTDPISDDTPSQEQSEADTISVSQESTIQNEQPEKAHLTDSEIQHQCSKQIEQASFECEQADKTRDRCIRDIQSKICDPDIVEKGRVVFRLIKDEDEL